MNDAIQDDPSGTNNERLDRNLHTRDRLIRVIPNDRVARIPITGGSTDEVRS